MDFSLEKDHKKQIIIRTFFGEPDMECIRNSWIQLLDMKEFREDNYSLLSDYSRASVTLEPLEINEAVKFYKSFNLFRKSKHAVVTTQPVTTAYSTILESKGYCYKTFSNKEAALSWLEI